MRKRLIAGVVAVTVAVCGVLIASIPEPRSNLGSQSDSATSVCRHSALHSSFVARQQQRAMRAAGRPLRIEFFRTSSTCFLGMRAAGMNVGFLLQAPLHQHNKTGPWRTTGAGCGEGAVRTIVPDWVFTAACNEHDLCYLFHHDPATGTIQRRRGCDQSLLHDSVHACDYNYPQRTQSPLRWTCRALASTYWSWVRATGFVAWSASNPTD